MNLEKIIQLPYITDDLSNEDYHSVIEFISSSNLKDILISPLEYKYQSKTKKEQTPAMLFGSQYHSYMESIINNGDESKFEYINLRNYDVPTKEKTGKMYGIDTQKMQDYFLTKGINADKIISPENYDAIRAMKEMLWRNLELRKLLHGMKAEVSAFTELDGVKCKYRCDLRKEYKGTIYIGDWKTTDDCKEVQKHIVDFKYHLSAAFYSDLDFSIYNKPVEFFWVFQEKKPPYDFDVYFASDQLLTTGQYEYKIALDQYKFCLKNDIWLGVENFTEIYNNRRVRKYIDLPPWYMSKLSNINFYNK